MLKTCVEATPLHEKRLRKAKRKYLEEALLVLFKQQRLSAGWAGFLGETSTFDTELCSNWVGCVWASLRVGYTDDEIHNADTAGPFHPAHTSQ